MASFAQSDVGKLSPEAQALIHRMLDQDEEMWAIRRAVQRLSGERVMLQAISRYASGYAERRKQGQQARTETDDFIRLAGKKGVKVSELLRATLIETLVVARRKKEFTKADLFKLDDAERKRREFELKQRQARKSARREMKELELKERQMQMAEQRLQLIRDKAQAEIEKLDHKVRAGELLSPDDLRRIDEIFGLYDDTPQPTDDPEPEPSDGTDE
ncbi:MAG: hypothetical protein A3H27_18565 [Acidobacteria bacterium RIFCSPLOWO2_02_FULL_59_13]|nr:MAG: hypothetical protein A3H27_18565 [Acidobacteria bacterium RIFCSPLOWO2_02_FULL_59_13]